MKNCVIIVSKFLGLFWAVEHKFFIVQEWISCWGSKTHTVKNGVKKEKKVIFRGLWSIGWMNVCLDIVPQGKSTPTDTIYRSFQDELHAEALDHYKKV